MDDEELRSKTYSANRNDGKNPLTKETYGGGDEWKFR